MSNQCNDSVRNGFEGPAHRTCRLHGNHLTRNLRLLQISEGLEGRSREVIRLLGTCFPSGDKRDAKGASKKQLLFILSLGDLDDREAVDFLGACLQSGRLDQTQASHLFDFLRHGVAFEDEGGLGMFEPPTLTAKTASLIEAIRDAGGEKGWVSRDEVARIFNPKVQKREILNPGSLVGWMKRLKKRGLTVYESHIVNHVGNLVYAPHIRLTDEFSRYLQQHSMDDLVRDR